MSDTADRIAFEGKQLLNKARLQALRRRMQAFVSEHEDEIGDFKSLRHDAAVGTSLSEAVVEERSERF